jgi:molybdenum cofactor cytidylyltransferase
MNSLPKINGLVLSAGLSSRMPELKALMEFAGMPFLAGILLKLAPVCDSIIVVTGHESERIKNETQIFLATQNQLINKKIIWQFNPDYKKGMFSSLRSGLRSLKNDTWTLYHFVDQPALPQKFYHAFRNECDENHDWIQPTYQNKKGHPILFSPKMRKLILESAPSTSLRELKNATEIRKKYWPFNYPQILQDFNSIEDIKVVS